MVSTALIIHFYIPVAIDIVKYLLGRDDLKYPFVLKANYLIFDPKQNYIIFMVYTIVSRAYINIFLMGFYVMDLFLVMLFFYVSSYMESVKFRIQFLADNESDETGATGKIKKLIDEHVAAINMVKLLDNVTSNIMLSQFILFSFSFCFVLFNLTQVCKKSCVTFSIPMITSYFSDCR